MLIAMCVDPDDVGEVIQALWAGSAPAAVSYATHWRVDLVVDRWRIHIDDARKNLRRHFKRLVGIAGQDRRGQSIHRPVGRSDRVVGGIDDFDDHHGTEGLFVRDSGIEWDISQNRRLIDLSFERSASSQLGAFGDCFLHAPIDQFQCGSRDEGADEGLRVQGVARRQGLGARNELLEKLGVDLSLNDDSACI